MHQTIYRKIIADYYRTCHPLTKYFLNFNENYMIFKENSMILNENYMIFKENSMILNENCMIFNETV